MKIYQKRKLIHLSDIQANQLDHRLEETSFKNDQYFLKKYLLAINIPKSPILHAAQSLEIFHLIEQLKTHAEMLNRSFVLNQPYEAVISTKELITKAKKYLHILLLNFIISFGK